LSGDYGNYINSSILSQYLVAMFNVEPVGGISNSSRNTFCQKKTVYSLCWPF